MSSDVMWGDEYVLMQEVSEPAVTLLFDVITSFFSGYMFGGGTTAHRHTRTVPHDVTAGV